MDLVGSFAYFVAKDVLSQGGVARANRLDERAKIFEALAIAFGRAIRVR